MPILPLAQISPFSSRKGANCRILLLFGISFSAFRDFISSPNCSCCSSLKIVAFTFSLSSLLTTSVAVLCLFYARCTYATVFTSLLNLLNRSHWITAFFSSACIMKIDEGIFSSSDAKIRFTCSSHSLSARFRLAQWATHFSWVLQCWLLWCQCPLGCCYFSHSIGHKHLLLAMGTVYPLQNCSSVWPKLQLFICISCSLTICSFNLTAITAACNSSRGIERCLIGDTLHFPMTNAKSAEYSFGCERR